MCGWPLGKGSIISGESGVFGDGAVSTRGRGTMILNGLAKGTNWYRIRKGCRAQEFSAHYSCYRSRRGVS